MSNLKSLIGLAVAMIGIISSAEAESIRLALASEHQSMDPHYSRTSPNQNTAAQIFETLVRIDENMQRQPALAVSWQNIDALTWDINLRDGVRFHDGSTFDAQDVITSIARIPKVKGSPAPFISSVSAISTIEALDDLTIRVVTHKPTPSLMSDLGSVYILPSELGDSIPSADFDSGKATIGTGPYRFVSWIPNESLILAGNTAYWGGAPAYSDVTIRYIPNAAARVATLLAGDVDAVDKVPPSDVKVIEQRDGLKTVTSVSGRMVYLHLDSARRVTPHITAKDGGEIPNPLRDARVRKALSLMIDRAMIVSRIQNGLAEVTNQMVPPGFGGYNAAISAPEVDLKEAKRLLTQAGYKDGFKLTLHGPNDRYVNDAKVLQAISQLFARAGLDSTVQAMPKNIYFKSASAQKFSLFLVGFGTTSGNSLRGLRQVISSHNKEAGTGTFNRRRFSSTAFDAEVEKAAASFDREARDKALARAAEIAFTEETAIIPLYFEQLVWAMKKGLHLTTTPIERTIAQNFSPDR